MTDTTAAAQAAAAASPTPPAPQRAERPNRGLRGPRGPRRQGAAPQATATPRAPRSHPVLEQLAALYPALFGEQPLPLKRGIFQDLIDAHPGVLEKDALKLALSLHTRSGRYLNAVAQGQPRHDLQGNVVESMAPEHVYHALGEVFRRRQQRSDEDLTPKLRRRIAQAFEASGLTREAYDALVRGKNEAANAVLDAALQDAAAQAAKDEALLRAFEASGQSEAAFADMYGLPARSAAHTLQRARQRRNAQGSAE